MAKRSAKTRRPSTSADPVTAYAVSVTEGEIVAGPHVRAACARHLKDLERAEDAGLSFDRAAAARIIGYFRDVLTVEIEEQDEDGTATSRAAPFELQPWQRFIVGSLFGWKRRDGFRQFRRAYVEIGKGNGKSPLAASIGHYMLTATGKLRAEVYAAASQKDQAMVMFRDAVAMWERSPALNGRLLPSGVNPVWQLTDIARSSFFKPISSENKGKSGIRPYCALIDEVHEHPNADVIEMLRAGTKGNQEALIFEITNSGFDRKSVCRSEHEYTVKVVSGGIENDAWFGFIASLDENDEPFEDEDCWIKANPNLGVSIRKPFIREQVVEATGMGSKENIVRRLHFCQWTDSEAAAFSRPVLEKVLGDVAAEALSEKGYPCFGGLDLSRSSDLTAFTLTWLLETTPDQWRMASKTWFWTPKDSLIDDDSFAAAAAVDAQNVTDKAGNTIKRYRLAGTYDLTDEPANALQGMLDACDRTLYLTPEGKIGITGGRYVAPDVAIGQNAVLSIGSLEIGNGKRATFNRLKTSFLSPPHDYQVIEGDPWVDQPAIDEAGETLEADFSRPWVVSHNQLRRLAKIHTAKQNPRYRITGLVTSRKGLPALYEDSVTLNLPRYGISGPFRIDRAVAAGDGSTCTFDLTSIDPDAYSFNPATEEGVAPPLPNVNTGLVTPPPPTGLTTLVERRVVNGTTTATFVRLLCTEPARLDLSLIGRYRRVGDTAWLQMAREGANRGSVISSVLADGETYEFQGALATYGRSTQSAWTPGTPLQVVATADAAAPAAPTYNSATRSGGTVTHIGKFPNSANARRLRLRRALGHGAPLSGASVVDTQAGGPNQSGVELTDSIGLGLWRYWLDCLNGSGVASDPAPQSPREILYAVPAGNLLTAPYDFTDAAWTKSNVTVAAGAAGPDGGGSTTVRETAATGTHYVSQTATITAGRHRVAIGIKADGRSRAQLRLGNGDLSSYASVVFNLSTEGIGTVNYTGSAVTNGVASLIRVSADYWLAIVTADIAAASAAGRLLTVNDANSASYAGDTSKGLGLWAASLRPA